MAKKAAQPKRPAAAAKRPPSKKQPSGNSSKAQPPADSIAAEFDEEIASYDLGRSIARAESRGGLDQTLLEQLQRHVVNLTAGKYSTDGHIQTDSQSVAAIFNEHIPAWRQQRVAAGFGDEPLRIVLYAHGGLTSEKNGLLNAFKQLGWWKANGIYPIWFVWETGFLESVWQTFQGSTREVRALEAPRGWTDVTDRIWESVARRLGPKLLWSGMKRSAQLSFAAGGGGRDFAGQLAQFCQAWSASPLELHAAIHSAGSIFFAHGLPYMLDNGVPNIRGLHLMAPAIRNDLFRRRLLDRMNNGIDWTTIYTMRRNLELDDSVGPYGKSLLYLIHYALEDDRETPILGLEESLRRDTAIATKFGLRGTSNQAGDVLWSKTPRDTDRNSTRATSHGDFDNDP
ncbi:MAG: hypothetical protein KDA62_16120, partial [Planctomycetales bacterium]|nr:hypothetical protein [Planctomycetales bacterium]